MILNVVNLVAPHALASAHQQPQSWFRGNFCKKKPQKHYSDVIMSAMASEITRRTIVYWTVYSGADQRKHQSSTSLAFVRGIHRWPAQKMFPFDVIMLCIRYIASLWFNKQWSREIKRSKTHQYLCWCQVCLIKTITGHAFAHIPYYNLGGWTSHHFLCV